MMDTSKLQNKKLVCVECGRDFEFAIGEQLYFKSKCLSEPKRCPQCRLKRKTTLVRDGEA
jgi:DNA-directed RNA polymerase subunit RPC12/RpoP